MKATNAAAVGMPATKAICAPTPATADVHSKAINNQ
jgi:hypothetical protein